MSRHVLFSSGQGHSSIWHSITKAIVTVQRTMGMLKMRREIKKWWWFLLTLSFLLSRTGVFVTVAGAPDTGL